MDWDSLRAKKFMCQFHWDISCATDRKNLSQKNISPEYFSLL